MPPLPKGECPTCGRVVAIRVNGDAREHRDPRGEPCAGSGRPAPPVGQLSLLAGAKT